MDGWIKLHRKFLDWEWWDDPNTVRTFLYLLLKSNHKEKKHKGTLILRGQHRTGIAEISAGTSLSFQQTRTAISKLKTTNEITTKSTNRGTLITICKYKEYQQNNSTETDDSMDQATSQATRKQQSNNKPGNNQITTNKNEKKEKNEKKKNITSQEIEVEFESWWKDWRISIKARSPGREYPGEKAESLKFFRVLRKKLSLEDLRRATRNYLNATGEHRKDAHRFLNPEKGLVMQCAGEDVSRPPEKNKQTWDNIFQRKEEDEETDIVGSLESTGGSLSAPGEIGTAR
jgi:hypothetical protein